MKRLQINKRTGTNTMMNLYTKKWTDQKGQTWELPKLVPQHLMNIRKMLEGVISGDREQPEGSSQSIYELKASLSLINREIKRRETADISAGINVSRSYTVSLRNGITVAELYEALGKLPATATLTNRPYSTLFVFSE